MLGLRDVDGGINLEVRTEVAEGVAVYRIVGRLDALTSPNLESAAGSAISGGNPRIIFDMSEVTFISSAGLRVILKTAKQAATALRRTVRRDQYPAPFAIVDLWQRYGANGTASYEAEARSISDLMCTPTSRNLVRVFLLQDRLKAQGGSAAKDGAFSSSSANSG